MKIARVSLAFLLLILATNQVIAYTEVLFSPDDKPTSKLLEYIKSSKKRIYAAVYMLTDKIIAEALIDAQINRNVDVQVVIDKITYESIFGKGKMLQDHGMTIFIYDPPKTKSYNKAFNSGPIMHHKFALFDNIVWTGSFNWTVAANRSNQENVIITDDQIAQTRYAQCFERLKSLCLKKKNEYRSSKEPSALEIFIHNWKNFIRKRGFV
ncbi:hypothetical protein FJ364_04080 [Candidatus Dependentiae bacterium]|nr:hypothetical protein [Candidatus Dependentiae bacterium]